MYNNRFEDDSMRLNVLLLLDENSQRKLQTGVSEIVSHGAKVINSLEEITEDLLEDYTKVVILEDYILQENSISNVRLFKEIFGLDFIYIGSDDLWIAEMSTVAECHKMDITNLNYAQIFGAVMKDMGLIERYKLDDATLQDSANRLKESLLRQGTFSQASKEMYDSLVVLIDVLSDKDKTIKSLHEHLQIIERENLTSTEQADATYNELNRVMEAEYIRDKSLLQYEVILSQDVYRKVSLANFTKRPLVLYFKQFTKLNHFDKFILTIYNTLRLHKGLRCKALKLYGSTDAVELALQPNYVKVIRNSFKHSDIESNDFLAKYGDYTKILEIILNNKLEIDVLLVFDCKGNQDRVLNGCDLTFDICQNKSDAVALGLDTDLTIVNAGRKNPMGWTVDEKQLSYLNERDSINYLSAIPVIQNILSNIDSLMEGGEYYE